MKAMQGCRWLPMALLLLAAGPGHAEDLDLCLRGWDAHSEGRAEEALGLFDRCLREGDLSDASRARTYRNIGITLRTAGRPAEAIAWYDRAIALKPDDVIDDWTNRGNAHDEAGDIEEAAADYARAIAIDPMHGETLYNRGIFYERRGQLDKARADFLQAYRAGLRSDLLAERFAMYRLTPPED